jgi:hypothetical protein
MNAGNGVRASLKAATDRRIADAAERDVGLAAELADVSLPLRMRAVVGARAENPGASWTEVAAKLGLSVNAAVSLWRRAVKRRPA